MKNAYIYALVWELYLFAVIVKRQNAFILCRVNQNQAQDDKMELMNSQLTSGDITSVSRWQLSKKYSRTFCCKKLPELISSWGENKERPHTCMSNFNRFVDMQDRVSGECGKRSRLFILIIIGVASYGTINYSIHTTYIWCSHLQNNNYLPISILVAHTTIISK